VIDPQVLLAVLRQLVVPDQESEEVDLRALSPIVWVLMHPRVLSFLMISAPRLLQVLRSKNQLRRMISHRGLRGRADWPSTHRAQQVNPSAVICQHYDDDYDLPENRLFKHVLVRLRELADSLPERFRRSLAWTGEVPLTASCLVQDRIVVVNQRTRTLLQDVRLRAVAHCRQPGGELFTRALDTGLTEYQLLPKFVREVLRPPDDLPPCLLLPCHFLPENAAWIRTAARLYRERLMTEMKGKIA
jgi:hypothetical protein